MQRRSRIVNTLMDALPFIRHFNDTTIVIKYGGSAQIDAELKEKFARDIVLLYLVGIRPVIVHGGGKRISEILGRLDIESKFVDGLRITCEESMRIVEMVLSGEINKEVVQLLNYHGVKAVGVSGKDGGFIKAKPKDGGKYGYTGKVTGVDSSMVEKLIDEKFVPVIAPIAYGDEAGHPGFNINADTAASEVAVALKAKKIIFLTDTPGVLNQNKDLLETLTVEEVAAFKEDGTIQGGMIPKVDACLNALKGGVEKAHIIDGRVDHSILLELFTSEGIGTQIVKKKSRKK